VVVVVNHHKFGLRYVQWRCQNSEAAHILPEKKPAATAAVANAAPKKRHVGAAARRKMAAAQKKRWAAIKAEK
jgi:hypothetical protein